MNSDPAAQVTRILADLESGHATNTDALLQIVYHELRRLAEARLRQEPAGHTLQPTALVHEAYLRLIGGSAPGHWDSRGHFFAAAAEAMRRILVENARRKARIRHGGDHRRVQLDEFHAVVESPDENLLALDEALSQLTQLDARKADLVKLRYFTGLDEAKSAAALGISRATAARWWAFSKAWLFERLNTSREELP